MWELKFPISGEAIRVAANSRSEPPSSMAASGPQRDGSARAFSSSWSSEQRTEYWTPAPILDTEPMRSYASL